MLRRDPSEAAPLMQRALSQSQTPLAAQATPLKSLIDRSQFESSMGYVAPDSYQDSSVYQFLTSLGIPYNSPRLAPHPW